MAILRIFARFAYVPTLAIGLNIVAVWLVSRGFSYAWTGLLFAVAIGLSLLMEGVLPYEAAWNYSHADAGKDLTHGVIYEVANIAAIFLLPFVTAFASWQGIWPSALPIGI